MGVVAPIKPVDPVEVVSSRMDVGWVGQDQSVKFSKQLEKCLQHPATKPSSTATGNGVWGLPKGLG